MREGLENIYISFCENNASFCNPITFRFADYKHPHANHRDEYIENTFAHIK